MISAISAFAWVFTMMLTGRYLHQILMKEFHYDLTDDLEWIVVGIIFISVLPLAFRILLGRNKKK